MKRLGIWTFYEDILELLTLEAEDQTVGALIALISYSFRKLKKGKMGRGQKAKGVKGNSYSKTCPNSGSVIGF